MPHCCHGLCNSDSKYGANSKRPRSDLLDVTFIPFPKPKSNEAKCLRWIKLCGNAKISTPADITSNHYVCSKHFIRNRATDEYPDPMPALGGEIEQKHCLATCRKHPPAKPRDAPYKKTVTMTTASVVSGSELANEDGDDGGSTNSSKLTCDVSTSVSGQDLGAGVTMDENHSLLSCWMDEPTVSIVSGKRLDKSLGLITKKFIILLQEAPDGILDLSVVSIYNCRQVEGYSKSLLKHFNSENL